MKIALAQLDYTVNHIDGNRRKIVEAIRQARERHVDLVVFSELSICGYPPYDLLHSDDIIIHCNAAISEIAKHCEGIAAIVGAPFKDSKQAANKLHNSAYLLANGAIAGVHHKVHLSTRDVFDEYRYFSPGKELETFEVNGKMVTITIGNELWDDQQTAHSPDNNTSAYPVDELQKHRPELLINISSIPISLDTRSQRLSLFKNTVKRLGVPLIQVNQVGANTDFIADGCSKVFNSKGEVIIECKPFEEDLQIVSILEISSLKPVVQTDSVKSRTPAIHDALVMGIRDFFHKSGFTRATLGLSGGIDSAVVVVLAQRALGSKNVRVLILPSEYSSQQSVEEATILAKALNVQFDLIDISDAFNALKRSMAKVFGRLPENLTEENMQARVRGTMLMALSNKLGYLLLNTSNKSEAAVGYGTLYGDMCGALGVLGDVYKTDVYALARYINSEREIIPANTIAKPPSAELRPNQKDSDSLPPYDILDPILYRYIEWNKSPHEIIDEGFSPETVNRVIELVNNSEHKRYQSPPVLRISSKAFGFGRRMPLVARR